MDIIFVVPGEPKGKGRPRFSKTGNYVKTYTPPETASYEYLVKLEYRQKYSDIKLSDDAQVIMSITAYFAIPKSTSKKKREQMLSEKIRPTKKPDMDNIIKIIADSLNGIAYCDDSQIVGVVAEKYYSEIPRVVVGIRELSKENT